jgi:hypothetical protein
MSRKKQTQNESIRKFAAASMIVVAGLAAGKLLFYSSSPTVLGTSTLLAKNGSDDSGSNSGSGSRESESGDHQEVEQPEIHTTTEATSKPAESTNPAARAAEPESSARSAAGTQTTSNEHGSSGQSSASKIIIRKPIITPSIKPSAIPFGKIEKSEKSDSSNRGQETEHPEQPESPRPELLPHPEVRDAQDGLESPHPAESEQPDHVRVASTSADRFLLKRGNAGAVTSFPLVVDADTNKVTVTTPTGLRSITVLPQEAINNVLSSNIVTNVGTVGGSTQSESSELGSVPQLLTLTEKNGVPVYEMSGSSDQKLFGFFPVKVKKSLTVSAETGDVISVDTSLGSKLLDLVSF